MPCELPAGLLLGSLRRAKLREADLCALNGLDEGRVLGEGWVRVVQPWLKELSSKPIFNNRCRSKYIKVDRHYLISS